MRILIGADLVPTETNFEYFKNGDTKTLLGDKLCDILGSADYRIFNLEVPLTDELTPIKKSGPNLVAPTYTVNGYKAMGADLLTLANNHILDQGEQGFNSTLKVLDENGIRYVGAGENLSSSAKPYIIDDGDKKIGVYACAEHEFTIAEQDKAGANPFDALESLDHISDLKAKGDYVIVLYHGGKEYYRYPSPRLQKVCRKICEKGADLVVCQHSHCVGCQEKWGESTIVYGQGNFLFDRGTSDFWQTSVLIELNTENREINYIPLRKNGIGVRFAEDGDEILSDFFRRTQQIKDKQFVIDNYREYARDAEKNYLTNICGVSFAFRVIDKLYGHRLKFSVPRARRLSLKNYIDCEAHNELLSAALEEE